MYSGFIQDDWTLGRRFTLNLGLRYDVEPKVTNTNFDPAKKYPVVENIYTGPQSAYVNTATLCVR